MNKQRAYGYVRVSSDEEGGNNASIAAQIAAIRDHAQRNDIEMVEIFKELNVSGRKLRRKQFDRMIAQATAVERPVQMVIVYAFSRFACRLLTQVTSEHKLTEAGVRLVSLTEGFGDDANGQLVRSMIAVVNEKYAVDARFSRGAIGAAMRKQAIGTVARSRSATNRASSWSRGARVAASCSWSKPKPRS